MTDSNHPTQATNPMLAMNPTQPTASTQSIAPAQTLDEQDAKLLILARGARGRIGAQQGAAIRDEMGRTYSGATVATEHLTLSALQLAVASALAAGARGAEAAVVVQPMPTDLAAATVVGVDALRDLAGAGIAVYRCTPDGTIVDVQHT